MSERTKKRKGLSSLFRRRKISSRSEEGSLLGHERKVNNHQEQRNTNKTPVIATNQRNNQRTRTTDSTKISESMGVATPTTDLTSLPILSPPPTNGGTKHVVTTALKQQSKRRISISNLRKPPSPLPSVPRQVSIVSTKPESTSWFSRTEYFQKITNWAFDLVDTDGSGCVDEKELYSGLLLIHLKLGSYAGPAACRPVSRNQVRDVFQKRDVDGSGSLDREEFGEVIAVLFGNVMTRVIAQWSLTLIIVPMVAKLVLDFLYWLVIDVIGEAIVNLEDYEAIEYIFVTRCHQIGAWLCHQIPDLWLTQGVKVISKVQGMLEMVPDSVWDTVPVTLISCILGCLAVPYIIFRIDDFFQSLADKDKRAKKISRE